MTLKLKVLKFLNVTKTVVIKMLITIPLSLETMQQLSIKPWRSPRASVAGKNSN